MLLRLNLELDFSKKVLRNRLILLWWHVLRRCSQVQRLYFQLSYTASFSSCATLYNVFIASFPCASQGRRLHKVNLSLSRHAIELVLDCANPMVWSIYGPVCSKTICEAKRPRRGDQHQRIGLPKRPEQKYVQFPNYSPKSTDPRRSPPGQHLCRFLVWLSRLRGMLPRLLALVSW